MWKQYYRPWELRMDEEDRIAAQVKEAQAQIDRELDEMGQRSQPDGRNGAQSDGNFERGC